MAWRYLVKLLIFPPGGPLLLMATSLFIWRRQPYAARCVLAFALLLLWLFSTPRMVQWLATPLETHSPINISTLNSKDYDAIVILGGGREIYAEEWGGHEVSVLAMQRVRYGAQLAKATNLPVLTSGGLHHGAVPPSEAKLMAEVLTHDFGLPQPILEEKSRTTWENATHSAAILLPNNPRILLVTHAWHMQRSVWSYTQQGFVVTPAPVAPHHTGQSARFWGLAPEAQALWKNVQLLNEWAGLLLYPRSYRP